MFRAAKLRCNASCCHASNRLGAAARSFRVVPVEGPVRCWSDAELALHQVDCCRRRRRHVGRDARHGSNLPLRIYQRRQGCCGCSSRRRIRSCVPSCRRCVARERHYSAWRCRQHHHRLQRKCKWCHSSHIRTCRLAGQVDRYGSSDALSVQRCRSALLHRRRSIFHKRSSGGWPGHQ